MAVHIQGHFHQGNLRFGSSAGKQCMCNSLVAICFERFLHVSNWTASDLDEILMNGDALYNQLGFSGYLAFDDLPSSLNLPLINCAVSKVESCTVELTKATSSNEFLGGVEHLFRKYSHASYGCIVVVSGVGLALLWEGSGNDLYLVDSHSRDQFGTPSPNGSSVVLKFSSLLSLQIYIDQVYVQGATRDSVYMQLQVVKASLQSFHSRCSIGNQARPQPIDTENEDIVSFKGVYERGTHMFHLTFQIMLTAFCWSHVRRIPLWKTADIHVILDGANSCVSSSTLPSCIQVGTFCVPCEIHETHCFLLNNDTDLKSYLGMNLKDVVMIVVGNMLFLIYATKKNIYVVQSTAELIGCIDYSDKLTINKFSAWKSVDQCVKSCVGSEARVSTCFILDISLKLTETVQSSLASTWRKRQRANAKLRYRKRCATGADEDHVKKVDFDIVSTKRCCSSAIPSSSSFATSDCVTIFREKVNDGPYFVCTVCNRTLYKKSVMKYVSQNYEPEMLQLSTGVVTYDGNTYICKTCHQKLKMKKIPCQAVYNKLEVYDLPSNLNDLRRLETVLLAQRILFKKIVIMPKGQQPKMKGSLCNVPVSTADVCNTIPQPLDSNGIVLVKLKRKLNYKGHVLLEPVRPRKVHSALTFLCENNLLYSNIHIDVDNASLFAQTMCNSDIHTANPKPCTYSSSTHVEIVSNHESIDSTCTTEGSSQSRAINMEESGAIEPTCDSFDTETNVTDESDIPDPLDQYRSLHGESAFIHAVPCGFDNDFFNIAPGENKTPSSIAMDRFCEELAHPHLFPYGKYGYNIDREVPLTFARYVNQRLLNYKQKFASDADYIFFCQSVSLQKNLSSRINIAMRKVCSDNVNAGELTSQFKDTVLRMVASDKAYKFMDTIKGTPAYWQKFLHEVLAMVKQLGLPSFFLTLSCADLRWPDIFHIICNLNKRDCSAGENMSYFEKCEVLNSNPVVLARHFQYRVELFFTEIVLGAANPVGKVTYYAIRVEFQVRGSPHIHSLIWTAGTPTLTDYSSHEEYISFVDSIVSACLPDPAVDIELHQLVTMYQLHSHSKTCRKYKNVACRFGYGKFFTDRTILAQPIPEGVPPDDKKRMLVQRNSVLSKVKTFIDSHLNPKKEEYTLMPILDILNLLQISEKDYYDALSISSDSEYELHLRRPPDSCFVNNYFPVGLRAWNANMDIQPVFNYYKAIVYMCSYLSKAEDEVSDALKRAYQSSFDGNTDFRQQMLGVARAYSSVRECSVQEAVYHVLPELWLRKVFPAVKFANSNLPEHRYHMLLSEDEIKELPPDSTNIFKRNMIDRYCDRPNSTIAGGRYQAVSEMCYAQFLACYYIKPGKSDNINDYQPEVLDDVHVEVNHDSLPYPPKVPLIGSNETLVCRKVRAVLRYHVPNREKHPEKYAHHLLFLFYPFYCEEDLRSSVSGLYVDKLTEPDVLHIVNSNKLLFEPYGDIVDVAYSAFQSTEAPCVDMCTEQDHSEMDAISFNLPEDSLYESETSVNALSRTVCSDFIAQEPCTNANETEINAQIRSLNTKQREVFDVVCKWTRLHVKAKNSACDMHVLPLHLFITGGAGVGKSFLLSVLCKFASKMLSYHVMSNKPVVLVLAPTGVAALHVSGSTIHSSLGIPVHCPTIMPSLSDKMKSALRLRLERVQMIMIDEISMVSNVLLLHIHERLVEIFDCDPTIPFAGKSLILFGDLYQLPPVMEKPIFADYKIPLLNFAHLWHLFHMIELDEIVRQHGDVQFIKILNNARVGSLTEADIDILSQRCIPETASSQSEDCIHIFCENALVNEYNELRLQQCTNELLVIPATDIIPPRVPADVVKQAQNRPPSQCGGLAKLLKVKVGAKVMLTSNINVSDGLVNGQIGTVFNIVRDAQGQHVQKIYVKFADRQIGSQHRTQDCYAESNNVVPIERIEFVIPAKAKRGCSVSIRRTQFPLTLSWACTVHKVQGLGLNNLVFSFELRRQCFFNFGQVYVALSRATSLSGLRIIGDVDCDAVKANPLVTQEYERLTEVSSDQFIDCCNCDNDASLTIMLLNCRSLRRHASDIASDHKLSSADVLCLTETQLCDESEFDNDSLGHHFPNIIHNTLSRDKFGSLAFCVSDSVLVHRHECVPFASVLQIQKSNFYPGTIGILLAYKKHSLSLSEFQFILSHCHSLLQDIQIVLGDFNYDHCNSQGLFSDVLTDHEFVVQTPTHISGSLLDHVYIKRDFALSFNLHSCLKHCYFTDHDAVVLQLSSGTF